MADIHVYLHHSVDVDHWTRRHVLGEVPDRTPYGLGRLADHGHSLAFERSRPRKLLDYVQALTSRARTEGRVAVSWDEFTAIQMAAREPRAFLCTGVIWATDMLSVRVPTTRAKIMYLRHVLRRFDLVWCLSEAQVGPLSDWLGRGGPQVRYLPFGIDPEFFQPQVRSKQPVAPVLLSFGQDLDRDPETLLEALAIVIAERPEMQALVQVPDHVVLPHGVRRLPKVSHAELRERIASATAVVIATRPNLHVSGMTASLEAMAMGTPAVLTQTPGSEKYKPAWLNLPEHHPGDARGLATAILAATSLPALGHKFRDYVLDSHTTEEMVASLSEMIDHTRSLRA